ncbi:MAG: hypothetical protein EXR79_05280 [Myxococcales bacterium]|nr:hypothetical protein [Myxococcales bacterium]
MTKVFSLPVRIWTTAPRRQSALGCCVVALGALGVPALAAPQASTADAVVAPHAMAPADPAPGPEPLAGADAATATDAADEALPFKLSLPTATDRESWRAPGLRLQLGYGYGQLEGLGGAPSGHSHTVLVRVGGRLDAQWSLLGSFQYAGISGGLSGLRFAGTLDPTWNVTDALELAVGFGFGGLVEGRTGRKDEISSDDKAIVSSKTYVGASPPLPSCNGVGAAGIVRAAWSVPLGALSSVTLALQGDGQWTGCKAPVGRVEPDTARPVVLRQWWPHIGGHAAILVGWR